MNLESLGWNSSYQSHFEPFAKDGYAVGRIALEHKHIYTIYTESGDVLGEVSGKMRHQAVGRADFPAVGDWVVVSVREEEKRATIHAVLPRQSKFSRKAAGGATEEQIVATNVNTIFLVMALNQDFNLRRMERYLVLAWESGATPVVILSKADLCDNVAAKVAEVEGVAYGVPIHVTSSLQNEGLGELSRYLSQGQTVALLGSSGVGKSTLINRLYGNDIQHVSAIREEDGRGRHTTTHRELILLPEGGLLIDTPGMRELHMWDAEEGLNDSFQDIDALAADCYYRDCQHRNEPGCMVIQSLNDGTLDSERYNSYKKLQKEIAYMERKDNKQLQLAEKEKWKKIHLSQRNRP